MSKKAPYPTQAPAASYPTQAPPQFQQQMPPQGQPQAAYGYPYGYPPQAPAYGAAPVPAPPTYGAAPTTYGDAPPPYASSAYPTSNYVAPPPAPSNVTVVVPTAFDAGARFDGVARPNIPPPPPGYMPNAAQMASMQGYNVVAGQRQGNFWSGGSSGGYTWW